MSTAQAGERFYESDGPAMKVMQAEFWRTLGFQRREWEPGRAVITWQAQHAYSFEGRGGPIIHGGLITTLLDSAMGNACWTVLDGHETFLTGDLHVQFMRSARPGLLRAEGKVVKRNKNVVFCSADLTDEGGSLLASARSAEIVIRVEQAADSR